MPRRLHWSWPTWPLLVLTCIAIAACAPAAAGALDESGADVELTPIEPIELPDAESLKARVTIVSDTLHGYVIPDPYRWLEDFESDQARKWIEAQQSLTDLILGRVPGRERIRERLSELLEIPSLGSAALRDDRLFFRRREPDYEQPVLYVRRGFEADPDELIDPDKLGDDAPVGLDWWYPSDDGRLLAYGTSESGSELSTLRIMDVDTKELLADVIPYTRSASLAWEPDGGGFYYTRYPAPGDVPEGEEYFHRKVYYHALGTDYADDPLVFGGDLDMRIWTGGQLSTDGRFLLGYAYRGAGRNDLYVRDLEGEGGWRTIAEGHEARFGGDPIGGVLYMHTTLDAPNGRIVAVDLEHPERDWVEIIPEGDHPLLTCSYVGGRLLALYLKSAYSQIEVFETDGTRVGEIPLPELSDVFDWTGEWDGDDLFVGVSSYLLPPRILRYRVSTGELEPYMAVEAPIDATRYVEKQVWYPSRDGTMISMFLVHRRDIELDGSNPTILTGYGGFSVPVSPGFARNRYLWLDAGGVYAAPNIRGGGEYGEAWHRAGMLANKQNTFDDFIAAAEWLIENGYTRPPRLAVWGGSNGGLLIGAFITQRPDLARAAIAGAALLDMIRFHRHSIGSIWTPEYGSPEDPDEFEWLYAYSPYHQVVEGTEYPAVLLEAADTDTRVHPSHALKMTARLQAATSSDHPILLRFERQAGHAGGTGMTRILEELVDEYSFLMRELNVEY
jgi:prolyl oligopeptidase